jgi:cobalt-zinc-cadmium efflux system protein
MSTTQTALSVHLLIPENKGEDDIIYEIKDQLHERFEITHPTIQVIRQVKPHVYETDCISSSH